MPTRGAGWQTIAAGEEKEEVREGVVRGIQGMTEGKQKGGKPELRMYVYIYINSQNARRPGKRLHSETCDAPC
jgi:hypothetical protein